MDSDTLTRDRLCSGLCLPIAPIAITDARFDAPRQKLLWRYYATAGAGGAVADLLNAPPAQRRELLESIGAAPTEAGGEPFLRIALVGEAESLQLAGELRAAGIQAIAIALDETAAGSLEELLGLFYAVGETLPLIVYPQGADSRRLANVENWRRLLEIPPVMAVCVPAHRPTTVVAIRALAETRRKDICVYTANEINPVVDLVTPFRYTLGTKSIDRRAVGGMLRLWGVFTARAVELLERCHVVAQRGAIPDELLQVSVEVSELSLALADENHAGIREVLARQKFLLDNRDAEGKRPSREVIERAASAIENHPHLTDFAFVAARLAKWSEE
ncbi:hypothetical protein M4951_03240 [Blastopirellula sp. J2-11]|uniref:hypothetical protein n=1 Tax=Blastopirellula sp. J2-11 TaxID=2943192 RepID=UPI0021C7C84A|nr:hypothetical protein [Blastopirellula sp. J2-11]UUO07330.1 hypothetical protein M4951_03240 [Blastopirellula sp. J2-11]